MRTLIVVTIAIAAYAAGVPAQESGSGPYKILKTVKAGGDGGFDYVYADVAGRRLYIPRSGPSGRITVFNLDTLEPVGEIPKVSARPWRPRANGAGLVLHPRRRYVNSG